MITINNTLYRQSETVTRSFVYNEIFQIVCCCNKSCCGVSQRIVECTSYVAVVSDGLYLTRSFRDFNAAIACYNEIMHALDAADMKFGENDIEALATSFGLL